MGVVEGFEKFTHQREHGVGRERDTVVARFVLDHAHVAARDVLHRQIIFFADAAHVERSTNVRMIEVDDDARLVDEARHIFAVAGEFFAELFDDAVTVEATGRNLASEIDFAHAATGKHFQQQIASEGARKHVFRQDSIGPHGDPALA